MENNVDKFWETMDRISDILQILNYEMLVKDASNNDLMKELQQQDLTLEKQNLVLEEQTEKYLKSINEKLDRLLEERNLK